MSKNKKRWMRRGLLLAAGVAAGVVIYNKGVK